MHDWHTLYGHFITKLKDLVHTVWGWILILFGVLVEYFADYKGIVVVVACAIIFDAFWGIYAAVKRGKYAKSELMRDTFTKVIGYFGALLIFIVVEKEVGWDWFMVTKVAGILMVACELWSASGNIIIVNPRMFFFKLLRPALKGEIARKLGVEEDEVEKILQAEEEERKKKKAAKRKKKKEDGE